MNPTLSLLALGAAAALALPAQAAQGWAATATKVVGNDIIPAVQKAPMRDGEKLRVAIALKIHDKAGLDAHVAALAAGHTRHHLTTEEVLARHAPSAAEAEAVAAYLRASGFTDVKIAKNRMVVTAAGTAKAARAAFNTELAHFDVDGRDAYANTTEAQVPAHLAGIVNAVLGLQTVSIGHTHHVRGHLDAVTAAKGTPVKGGVAFVHEAPDFSTLYGADSLPPATNATIAIFTFGDVSQTIADLNAFTDSYGWPRVDLEAIQTSEPTSDTSGLVEWNMDTQASLAAAGGQVKKMLLYVGSDFSDESILAEFNAFVADNRAQVFNNSWGGCELANQASGLGAAADPILELAIAQGQTFSVSTGDSGSYACGTAKGGQEWPASAAWVMAIGGTTVYNKPGVPGKYVREETWGCANATDCFNAGGTGGGTSTTVPEPSWQKAVVPKGPGARGRNLPDVAFDADWVSGIDIMFFGTYDPFQPIGGTSLSAPIFSGLWARLQSLHDNKLMFPAMSIWGLYGASEAAAFHDVTVGTNGGWKALPGYDGTTGFGSFDAAKFNAFIDANPGSFIGQ